MKTYKSYIKIRIQELMAYRFALLIKVLSKIIYLFMQVALWRAFYKDANLLNSIEMAETIGYICIVNMVGTILDTDLTSWMNKQIRRGNIALEFIRPVKFEKRALARQLGTSVVQGIFSGLPVLICFFILGRHYDLSIVHLGWGVLSLIIAYFIQFFYSYLIGVIAFWLVVTWPFNMLLNSIYKLLSGVWIPVYLFPKLLRDLSCFLPFRFIFAVPVMIVTRPMQVHQIILELLAQIMWLVVLAFFCKITYQTGRRKMIVQGG